MSGVTKYSCKVQGLWSHSLKDQDFITELENTYYALLISNYGPFSSLTLIRNSAGSDSLTSSSNKLLEQLSFFHPCFKFINALINAQFKSFGVHSLYVGALCSGLLFRFLKLENVMAHRVIRDVSDWIQSSLMDQLYNDIQNYCIKIDIGKLNQVLCVVRGLVHSKSCHLLSKEESEHIAVKVVEAFLMTIPECEQKDFGHVSISTFEGSSSLNSCIKKGILYCEPDYSAQDLRLKLKTFPKENLKIIIFSVPLSHDLQESSLAEWGSNSSQEISFLDYIHKVLSNCLWLKEVKVIANQKFIHPALKYDFEKDGFLVIERLGTVSTDLLVSMTGSCPITNLSQIEFIIDDHIGNISQIEVATIEKKTYLNLQSSNPYQNITFVLTGINCYLIEYLKEIITTSIDLLQKMIKDPSAVVGAGCLECLIALILTRMKKGCGPFLAKRHDASLSKIEMVFDTYIETFLRLAVIPRGGKSSKLLDFFVDSSSHHLWQSSTEVVMEDSSNLVPFRCVCKRMSKRDISPSTRFIPLLSVKNIGSEGFDKDVGSGTGLSESSQYTRLAGSDPTAFIPDCILDSLTAKSNAIRLALDGFSELFSIGACIFDR